MTGDQILCAYFIIAAVVCVWTWIDNAGTTYVNGDPPSGLWAGFLWPAIAALFVALFIIRGCQRIKAERPRP